MIQTTPPATPPVQPHTGHPRKHPPSLLLFLTMSGIAGPPQSTRIHIPLFHANWDLFAGTPRPLATCHQGGIDSGPQVQATGRLPSVSRSVHGERSFKSPSPLGTLTTDPPPTKCPWHDAQPHRKLQQLRELQILRAPVRPSGSFEITRKRCRSISGAGSAPHATPADASAAHHGGGLALAPPTGTVQHSILAFTIKTRNSSQQLSVTLSISERDAKLQYHWPSITSSYSRNSKQQNHGLQPTAETAEHELWRFVGSHVPTECGISNFRCRCAFSVL